MRIWITDIQRFSLHDGPGIRTTVFFQGCPLRCLWCHNPECLAAGPKLRYTESRCMGCGSCVTLCEHSCHPMTESGHVLDRSRCQACGRCAAECPTGALGLIGEQRTPEEIIEIVARDRPFYDASGGGVTLSGGEPLAQVRGARALLRLAQARGIHTAVETCGYAEWRRIAPLLDLVDLWLYDVKHLDPGVHQEFTGVPNRRIIANLERLLAAGAAVILRIPLIPGHNDGDDFFTLLSQWLAKHDSIGEVHLMPYNRLARSKYAGLGLPYPLGDAESLPSTLLAARRAALERTGRIVRVGG
jgi:pyruvate formate lyase activating enzyme